MNEASWHINRSTAFGDIQAWTSIQGGHTKGVHFSGIEDWMDDQLILGILVIIEPLVIPGTTYTIPRGACATLKDALIAFHNIPRADIYPAG